MATTIGSLDLNAFSNLYSDSTQYFWFESNASATYGAGVHVTLVPDATFISNPTGQNILMNTDGFSIRNGLLPMMILDNDSLDFNAVDTSLGTYTTMATFGLTGATIGQTGGAHSIIDGNGQRFYASDGTTQLANVGYDLSQGSSSISKNPYYTFGTRKTTQTQYSSSSTYALGDLCVYNGKIYVCRQEIATPEAFTSSHWSYYIGALSMAEGQYTTASGWLSHAEGYFTTSDGSSSHSEGQETFAGGVSSHAEGVSTQAFGAYSHSEGQSTLASGDNSHAEGYYCQATYGGSHAEGDTTKAQNWYAHSEGTYTIASGEASHAQNENTQATKKAQTVIGSYNIADNSTETTHPSGDTDYGQYALIIGNGQYVPPSPGQPSSSIYSNALTVDWEGNLIAQGMAGQIIMFAGPVTQSVSNNKITTTAPVGYLLCDGSIVLIADYPQLAAILGTTYGGNGTTTFGLPDFRGRVGVGVGTGTATGASAHTLNQKAGNEDLIVPYHRHSVSKVTDGITGGSHNHDVRRTANNAASGSNRYTASGSVESGFTTSSDTHTHDLPSHNTNYTGSNGNATGANMMPYIGINYLICTGKTS